MSAMVRLSEAADGLTEVRALVLRLRGILNAVGREVDALEAENAKLRAALEKYGWHLPGCKARMTTKGHDCTCALAAALTPEPR